MNKRIILFISSFFIICLFFLWGRGPKSIIGGEAHNKQYELTFFQQTISGTPKNNKFIPAGTNTLVELNIGGNPSKLVDLIICDSIGTELMSFFPRIEEIRVNWISNYGQGSLELESKDDRIKGWK